MQNKTTATEPIAGSNSTIKGDTSLILSIFKMVSQISDSFKQSAKKK